MQPFANSGASAPNTTHNRLREEHSQIYVEPTYKHRTKVHLTSQKGLFIYSAKECGICVSANRPDWAIISSWRKQYIKWSWGTDAVSTKKKKFPSNTSNSFRSKARCQTCTAQHAYFWKPSTSQRNNNRNDQQQSQTPRLDPHNKLLCEKCKNLLNPCIHLL